MIAKRLMFWAALLGAASWFPSLATAVSFVWANDADVASLDPYTRQETFQLSFDGNFYEPLVRRDRLMRLEPALAIEWTQIRPLVWRFKLRRGVAFHDGTPFTADDVIFSLDRVRRESSALGHAVDAVKEIRKIDDFLIDITTNSVDPILPQQLAGWDIMSKAWCIAERVETPADIVTQEENYATSHENGTGPFVLKERKPGEKTIVTPYPSWWDKPAHNLTEAEFVPIEDDAARVAALLDGKLDLIYAVPPEAIDRIAASKGFKILHGPSLRTLFLGFDQARNELIDSSVKGKNPFQDRRVRRAVYQALDEDAIKSKVMRGYATPAALLVGPGVTGFSASLNQRLPFDPEQSRLLLADAGYKNGFEVGLDCPKDRYLNDEQICATIGAMLAKIGIAVRPHFQTRSNYFLKILAPKFNTSFFLLGFAPDDADAEAALRSLAHSRDLNSAAGSMNAGGYSNRALDALIDAAEGETDLTKRTELLHDALALIRDDVAFIPLHQQPIIWASKAGIDAAEPPDGRLELRTVVAKQATRK